MTATHYRSLLIAYLVVGISGGALDLVFPSLIPDVFQSAQTAHDDSLSLSRLVAFVSIGAVGLVLLLISIYGLYQFRPWAPRLALLSTLIAVFVWPFSGAYVQSGLAVTLNFLASYLWGGVLVLAFRPPISSMFARRDG